MSRDHLYSFGSIKEIGFSLNLCISLPHLWVAFLVAVPYYCNQDEKELLTMLL